MVYPWQLLCTFHLDPWTLNSQTKTVSLTQAKLRESGSIPQLKRDKLDVRKYKFPVIFSCNFSQNFNNNHKMVIFNHSLSWIYTLQFTSMDQKCIKDPIYAMQCSEPIFDGPILFENCHIMYICWLDSCRIPRKHKFFIPVIGLVQTFNHRWRCSHFKFI